MLFCYMLVKRVQQLDSCLLRSSIFRKEEDLSTHRTSVVGWFAIGRGNYEVWLFVALHKSVSLVRANPPEEFASEVNLRVSQQRQNAKAGV